MGGGGGEGQLCRTIAATLRTTQKLGRYFGAVASTAVRRGVPTQTVLPGADVCVTQRRATIAAAAPLNAAAEFQLVIN